MHSYVESIPSIIPYYWYITYVFSKHSKVYFSNFEQGFETQHVTSYFDTIITNCDSIEPNTRGWHTKYCIMVSYTFILWKHLSYFNTMLTYSARIWNHIEPNTKGWQGIKINCDSIISLYLMLTCIESLCPLIMLT